MVVALAEVGSVIIVAGWAESEDAAAAADFEAEDAEAAEADEADAAL